MKVTHIYKQGNRYVFSRYPGIAGDCLLNASQERCLQTLDVLEAARDKKVRPSDADYAQHSWNVQMEIDRLVPKTYIQHRKIFKDDSIVSAHSKWHDIRDLECNHGEVDAKRVIAAGGIVDGGYCFNLFREVSA